MFKRRSQIADVMRCSFCHKAQDSVQKLISSPGDERSYICDECVMVCASILEDDRNSADSRALKVEPTTYQLLLNHPLTPQLLAAVEVWIRRESLGNDAAEELAEVRAAARRVLGSE